MKNIFENFDVCNCPSNYSIEPHGNGYALYLDRCNHKHGYNLANITEPDLNQLNFMIDLLNNIINT